MRYQLSVHHAFLQHSSAWVCLDDANTAVLAVYRSIRDGHHDNLGTSDQRAEIAQDRALHADRSSLDPSAPNTFVWCKVSSS